MPEFFYIFIPVIIQGSYDFLGWYGIFKDGSGELVPEWQWLYRVIKETLDIPVTACLLYFVFHWNINLIAAFFILKWFGATDLVYIIWWKFLNMNKSYSQDAWWWWWTPLGLYRSKLIINPVDKEWFVKGILTLKEFIFQSIVGMCIGLLITMFF